MTVTLYQNIYDRNCLFKVLNDDNKLTLDCTLKENTSIITPTIIIKSDDNITSYNYVHIPDFDRYYFITDIISLSKSLWQINLKVDVLMSFQREIKSLNLGIERNEYIINSGLVDTQINTDMQPNITVAQMGDNDFQINKHSLEDSSNLSRYMLIVNGGGNV